jgi:hypothetical protein
VSGLPLFDRVELSPSVVRRQGKTVANKPPVSRPGSRKAWKGTDTANTNRAINVEPWEPPLGMAKKRCAQCRYWFAAPITEAGLPHAVRTVSPLYSLRTSVLTAVQPPDRKQHTDRVAKHGAREKPTQQTTSHVTPIPARRQQRLSQV